MGVAYEENSPQSGGRCLRPEKLSFIGPVMVLGGSLIMIVIALCTDCPQ